jgi:hypothetical protein
MTCFFTDSIPLRHTTFGSSLARESDQSCDSSILSFSSNPTTCFFTVSDPLGHTAFAISREAQGFVATLATGFAISRHLGLSTRKEASDQLFDLTIVLKEPVSSVAFAAAFADAFAAADAEEFPVAGVVVSVVGLVLLAIAGEVIFVVGLRRRSLCPMTHATKPVTAHSTTVTEELSGTQNELDNESRSLEPDFQTGP